MENKKEKLLMLLGDSMRKNIAHVGPVETGHGKRGHASGPRELVVQTG